MCESFAVVFLFTIFLVGPQARLHQPGRSVVEYGRSGRHHGLLHWGHGRLGGHFLRIGNSAALLVNYYKQNILYSLKKDTLNIERKKIETYNNTNRCKTQLFELDQ